MSDVNELVDKVREILAERMAEPDEEQLEELTLLVGYIRKFYSRIYKVKPLISIDGEGYVLYRKTKLWANSEDQILTLCRIIRRAIKRTTLESNEFNLVAKLLEDEIIPLDLSSALVWEHGWITCKYVTLYAKLKKGYHIVFIPSTGEVKENDDS